MLRLAVIGCGVMGSNHARIASQSRDFELVAVVDADLARARTVARAYGCQAFASADEVVDDIDCAIVAVPTQFHPSLAQQLISAGIHTLIEKPLALTSREATDICDLVASQQVVATVGHVERFNPAVLELDTLVTEPIHITAERISPYSARISTGVVSDLMIHDLDIVCQIANSNVVSVSAMVQQTRSATEDLAVAMLTFANGVTATLTASRIGQQKIRQLSVTQPGTFVVVNLLRQDVTIHRVDHTEYSDHQGMRFRETGVVEIPFLEHRGEPLALEQQEFAAAVNEARAPRVTLENGLRAVVLAEKVLESASQRSTVYV